MVNVILVGHRLISVSKAVIGLTIHRFTNISVLKGPIMLDSNSRFLFFDSTRVALDDSQFTIILIIILGLGSAPRLNQAVLVYALLCL